MKRILLVAAALLCACSSGSNGARPAATESPDLNSSLQDTRVRTPSGSDIEVDWQHKHTYNETKVLVGVDKAWSQYPTVFGELGIPTGLVDQKQHVFGNAGVNARGSLGGRRMSTYLDCGNTAGMSNADTYDVVVRVISQVIPADGGLSTVRTQVEGTAHSSGDSGPSVRCTSTGALEARIAHMMSELAAKPGN